MGAAKKVGEKSWTLFCENPSCGLDNEVSEVPRGTQVKCNHCSQRHTVYFDCASDSSPCWWERIGDPNEDLALDREASADSVVCR